MAESGRSNDAGGLSPFAPQIRTPEPQPGQARASRAGSVAPWDAYRPVELQSRTLGPVGHPCAPGLLLRLLLAVLVASGLLWSIPLRSDAQILGNDALPYAEALVRGDLARILTPHHPGTQLLALGTFRFGQWLTLWGADFAGALSALRWVSALGAGAAAAWLWAFATRRLERWSGLALALGFALSAGNWLYGAVGETYLPAAFALCGLLAGLIEAELRGQSPSAWKSAAWLFLACALRQDAVLVAPIVLLLAPLRRALVVLVLAGVLSLGFYGLAYAGSGTSDGFLPWLRGLADTGLWGAGLSWERLKVSLIVSQHALQYGVRFGGLLALGSYGLTAVAVLLLLWYSRHAGQSTNEPIGRALLALMAFVLLRLLFFTWWQPGNMEYHTTNLLPVFMGAALLLGRGYLRHGWRSRAVALWAWTGLLGLSNYWLLLAPNRGNTLQVRSQSALEAAGPGALTISLDSFAHFMLLRDGEHLPRLDASAWMTWQAPQSAADVSAAIAAQLQSGGRVLLLHEVDLMPRLHFPDHPVDQTALAQMMALAGHVLPLRTGGSEEPERLYALVLSP
jgi:hypothetical protein